VYLLLRAFNHWDFPKGMVEEGEEPLAAAIREVCEESTIDDLDFAWGEHTTQTGPTAAARSPGITSRKPGAPT
jgi:bis(5'-nucleosidyl)-tetraphosphatase